MRPLQLQEGLLQPYTLRWRADDGDAPSGSLTLERGTPLPLTRQNRACTTVAIAIVAETCAPFTVLPGLMNEHRIPELNVQNGVLKSLSFLFEYIGEMGKDYIYAVVPILVDALMDRDLVHRQARRTRPRAAHLPRTRRTRTVHAPRTFRTPAAHAPHTRRAPSAHAPRTRRTRTATCAAQQHAHCVHTAAVLQTRTIHTLQTACTTVMHMALGVVGLGNEDAMQHLLNLVWPCSGLTGGGLAAPQLATLASPCMERRARVALPPNPGGSPHPSGAT